MKNACSWYGFFQYTQRVVPGGSSPGKPEQQTRPQLSIPSTGRTGMKRVTTDGSTTVDGAFNTLNGSYRDEARCIDYATNTTVCSFNTLNGSYRDEAILAASRRGEE